MTSVTDLITYSVTDATIAEIKNEFGGLRVLDIDDEQGYALCKEARKKVRDLRLSIEDRRKELKAESLEFGRLVDAEAKRITALVTPVEEHLAAQLAIVDDEKKRREAEAARIAKERIDTRQRRMAEVGAVLSYEDAASISDEKFEMLFTSAEVAHKRAEEIRAAERAQLEKLQAEQKARDAELEAERAKTRALEAETARMRDEAAARDREAARVAEESRRRAEAELSETRRRAEAEAARVEDERRRAELEAAVKVADDLLFNSIKRQFPTLEVAWVEIARLRKLLRMVRGEVDFEEPESGVSDNL